MSNTTANYTDCNLTQAIDRLLNNLHRHAKNVDPFEYGLPSCDEEREDLIAEVKRFWEATRRMTSE